MSASGLLRNAPPASSAVASSGQLGLDQLAEPRQEEVQQVELADPAPRPLVPGVVRVRRRVGVALEQPDLVTVPGEQHGPAEPGDAASNHDHVGHRVLPPARSLRQCAPGAPSMVKPLRAAAGRVEHAAADVGARDVQRQQALQR